MILAIVVAPILAVQAQGIVDSVRNHRARRHTVFEILMRTRAARVSYEHVQALNMIDLAFSEKRICKWRWLPEATKVIHAWKEYKDNLDFPPGANAPEGGWERNDELFVSLLYEMSVCLKYDFDRVALKRAFYSPRAHGFLELEQQALRKWILEVLNGQRSIPIHIVEPPTAGQAHDASATLRSPQVGTPSSQTTSPKQFSP
ncbi:MAG: hypothetical protein IT449_00365 [Phycisphaerales bacterium]|nr:hypothetical protein [Phycisphaerales bacterium]